jgi:VIT1/CCC1 family predicted Fe2+/Mn2+ transporter
MGISNTSQSTETEKLVHEPIRTTRLLDPIERMSEIIFGLIMALSFTCAISVAESERNDIRLMLIAALGCNIAWGLVDAVMFILTGLTQKARNLALLNFINKATDTEKAREYILETLPQEFSKLIGNDTLEQLRRELKKIPESQLKIRLNGKDFKMALAIFLLVFLSTFPVAIPFILFRHVQFALRVSNLVAVILLFLCGWFLGRYGSYNKIKMGLIMACVGTFLVLLTISLGG